MELVREAELLKLTYDSQTVNIDVNIYVQNKGLEKWIETLKIFNNYGANCELQLLYVTTAC